MSTRIRSMALLACVVLATVAAVARTAELKAPDDVKNALRILAYVQDDMARKLPSHSYTRLPHESQEFTEASAAMRDAVAKEPDAFKAQVERALGRALAASDAVAEISKSNDEAKITSAVAAVDAALQQLNRLFPEPLRPVTGQLGPGPGRGQGPPPGLR